MLGIAGKFITRSVQKRNSLFFNICMVRLMSHTFWFVTGLSLIVLGIVHEMLQYWLEWRFGWYKKWFGDMAFQLFALQLGTVWCVVGILLSWLLLFMPRWGFHGMAGLKWLGALMFLVGLGAMWHAFRRLGWFRMMKGRLFSQQEPPQETSGLFRWMANPMYHGSQLAMLGMAVWTDNAMLIVYAAVMVVLQWLQARLENRSLYQPSVEDQWEE